MVLKSPEICLRHLSGNPGVCAFLSLLVVNTEANVQIKVLTLTCVVYARTCLRYFLPPQWVMDKDSVTGLSFEELASFPLEDFFDHYERGLKKVGVALVVAHCQIVDSVFSQFLHAYLL